MVFFRALMSVVLMAGLVAFPAMAQQKGKIEGVWRAVSLKEDGIEKLALNSDLKFITAEHWIWINQDKTKTTSVLEKKAKEDPIAEYLNAFGAGAGTYTLVGNTYTEKIEYFPYPAYIGLSIPFTVRVEGNRLYQSGLFPWIEGGKKTKDVLLEETYERLE